MRPLSVFIAGPTLSVFHMKHDSAGGSGLFPSGMAARPNGSALPLTQPGRH